MSSNINELVETAFPGENPLLHISGEPHRVAKLKTRLLQSDVVLCVNDKCHLFAWAGEHCEKHNVPTLNLCPSQHEIQRAHAGVLTAWQQIFARLTWPDTPCEEDYSPVLREKEEDKSNEEEKEEEVEGRQGVPMIEGLYVTFLPLIADLKLLPLGREVVGPVYMGAAAWEEQKIQLRDSGLLAWLNSEETQDSRPVVYVSLGSMIRNFTEGLGDSAEKELELQREGEGRERGIRALFKALLSPPLATACRVLTTIPRAVYQDLEGQDSKVYFSPWVPQFAGEWCATVWDVVLSSFEIYMLSD